MANLKVCYYNNGDLYTLPPYATTTPPKQKPTAGQFRYDYHFNEKPKSGKSAKCP